MSIATNLPTVESSLGGKISSAEKKMPFCPAKSRAPLRTHPVMIHLLNTLLVAVHLDLTLHAEKDARPNNEMEHIPVPRGEKNARV